jgi:hypothetical protein
VYDDRDPDELPLLERLGGLYFWPMPALGKTSDAVRKRRATIMRIAGKKAFLFNFRTPFKNAESHAFPGATCRTGKFNELGKH